MNITFAFLESLRLGTSPKSLSKKQLRESKHHTQGVDQWKLRRADILALIYTYSKLPTSKNSEAFSKPQALYALFFFSFFFQFFYIQNREMCLSKKNLNQYFVDFCPARNSIFSENISHAIA